MVTAAPYGQEAAALNRRAGAAAHRGVTGAAVLAQNERRHAALVIDSEVRRMPRHEIEVEIPPKVVLNSDVRFVVRSDGQKLGELLVSRGSIAWVPGHSPRPIHMRWEQFDELLRDVRRGRR